MRPDLLLEPAQPLVALAQLLGDVVDAAAVGVAFLVLVLQSADQAGHGLVDPLDGDRRAALGGLQPGGDGVDRGAQPVPRGVLGGIGVIDPAVAPAAIDGIGGVIAARQGHDPVVIVLENHGVEPLAERHAGAPREILGDLARLGLDTLHAPRRGCAH